MRLKNKNKVDRRFRELWEAHEPYIRRLCSFKLKSVPERIDDCVQDVFHDLLCALRSGADIVNPSAWLSAVANNKIKDIYKSVRKERERILPLFDDYLLHEQPADPMQAVFEPEISEEKLLLIKNDILKQLSDRERTLFKERYELEYEIKDIARLHETNENNVYQLLYRLKAKILKLVRDYSDNMYKN